VAARATTEEFARDSFENLLFGICRFYECTGKKPLGIKVVSWSFKEERFDLHREAIRYPRSAFEFVGVGNPRDLVTANEGERETLRRFQQDPFGAGPGLRQKRDERNPFRRTVPYRLSCPELLPLLDRLERGEPDGGPDESLWQS
jgi:hypothetical protein